MSKHKLPPANQTIEFTERAILDLHAIELYSATHWGQRTADQYLQEIQDATELIRKNPSLLRKDPVIGDAFLFYRARKHLMVCQRISNCVIVLTVIHTSMDLATRLLELEPLLLMEGRLLAAELAKRGG